MAGKLKNNNELKVGLFLVIPALIVVAFIILKLGYSMTSSTMDLYLKVDSLKSVKKGTSVQIKGYEIGRVVEIRPVYSPEIHFLAVMRVEKELDLFENCSAVIQNKNIIGDAVIEIRNPEHKGLPLQNGDVIEGIEYVSLDAVVQDVHDLLASLTSTVGVIEQISLDSRANIGSLLSNLSSSVSHVNSILENSQKDILAMLSAFRETAVTMNRISKELEKHPVKFLFKEGESRSQ